jgi:two-component system invasion response regulator UvrY
MKILIADDHAVFRRGLKEILAERYPGAAFGEAETSRAVLEQVWKTAWDVLVLDISMPGRSGVEILKEIKHAQPRLPILMLSMHPEEQYALRVLEAGAAGYLTKAQASHALVAAVQKVMAGGKYISHHTAEHLVDRLRGGGRTTPHEKLSNREFEILKLIALGESMKRIARDLSVSPQTVSTHRARMLKKMGLSSTASLVRYAVQNKLVD